MPETSGRLLEALAEGGAESQAPRLVDRLLAEAVRLAASDVHLEPLQEDIAVRFRIDGMLHEAARLPLTLHERLIGRLKVLSRLMSYEHDLPQEGRIDPASTELGKAMRVSTFPTVYGEKAVVRVLGANPALFHLEALGFSPDVQASLAQRLDRLQGTLLLTGPSSSGKTTTIYALLRHLLDGGAPGRAAPHVVTLEDPVEYRLGDAAQTEIRPHVGFTYEKALRSLLRQDPEVIMLGEIRDAETAGHAVQAGLTGHFVISTIHSGTAAGVFTRLLDMGIEPFLAASSVSGVLAQRLVRRVCPECAVEYAPEPPLLAAFALEPPVEGLRRGRGCEACNGLGYAGRFAMGEFLSVTETFSEHVLERRPTRDLQQLAVEEGMKPLQAQGLQHALRGETTLEELLRVLPPFELREAQP
jgi:type II secretory ATPase GspE/PulE/Tfp pilus assembly ATPase PilB-like protein